MIDSEPENNIAQSASHSQVPTIRLSLPGLFLLCVVLIVATGAAFHFFSKAPTEPVSLNVPPEGKPARLEQKQPWGELFVQDITIEQPTEYVSFESTDPRRTEWFFGACNQTQAANILGAAGLTDAECTALLQKDVTTSSASGTTVTPPDSIVLGLKKEVRAKLYQELARWPENKLCAAPYQLATEPLEKIFVNKNIRQEIIDLVRSLTFVRGGITCFSDLNLVLNRLSSPQEKIKFLQALTFQQATLVQVHIDDQTDIDELLGYWGSVPEVRSKDLRPLLESIQKTPEGFNISLLYFLPPFARERLYTFPFPSKPGDTKMDCHWTALNFFNATTDDRFQDTSYASTYVNENFYQIGAATKCGDLIFLRNSSGAIVHSAVHIAGDIVFTKNGINYAQPWILMRMKNLVQVYTGEKPPEVIFYRRKES